MATFSSGGMDPRVAELLRYAKFADLAWLKGGDVYNRNRYTAQNIDQYMPQIMAQEQRLADQSAQEQWIQLDDGYWYLNGNPNGPAKATPPIQADPNRTTPWGGAGDVRSQYQYGHYQLNPEDAAYFEQVTGYKPRGAFANVFAPDVGGVLDVMASESFNPFYGMQYNPALLAEQISVYGKNPALAAGLDPALQRQADYQNRLQGGMADYLYDVTSDIAMTPYRREIMGRWNQYISSDPSARFQTAASQEAFDALGLSDFGLTFDPSKATPGTAMPQQQQMSGMDQYYNLPYGMGGYQQGYGKGGGAPNYGMPAKGGYNSGGYRSQFGGGKGGGY